MGRLEGDHVWMEDSSVKGLQLRNDKSALKVIRNTESTEKFRLRYHFRTGEIEYKEFTIGATSDSGGTSISVILMVVGLLTGIVLIILGVCLYLVRRRRRCGSEIIIDITAERLKQFQLNNQRKYSQESGNYEENPYAVL